MKIGVQMQLLFLGFILSFLTIIFPYICMRNKLQLHTYYSFNHKTIYAQIFRLKQLGFDRMFFASIVNLYLIIL